MKRASARAALTLWMALAWMGCADDGDGDGDGQANNNSAQDAGQDTPQDAGQDAAQDAEQDAAQDVPQDMAQDAEQDAGQDAAQDAEHDAEQDAAPECGWELAEEPLPEPPRYTPRWAFEPWISKDISDRDDTFAFVEGFRSRDIPVGVVVLDSPWETYYNTFTPNPTRYADFGGMVSALREDGVRVVLWVTQMTNNVSLDLELGGDRYVGVAPNYLEGRRCGFYVEDGRSFNWWKGQGSGVDFFDAKARAWWHAQQDQVLDLGVAGWKLDFGESYIRLDEVKTDAGLVPHQAYSEAYYRDFLAYGVHKRGAEEFVTMVRGWDASYDHAGRFYARPEHAPVVWMGDNRRDWVGLEDALDHTFRSALAGYVVVGTDIGGYLDRDDQDLTQVIPFSYPALARWTVLGALSPFMQLHGRANLTPWNLPAPPEGPADPDEYVRLYRYWAKLHTEMIPFWFSLAQEAYAGGPNLLRPVSSDEATWAGDWRYALGEALLVAPIVSDAGVRDVALPAGARWHDWWRPEAEPVEGGQTLEGVSQPLDRVPLYVKAGAIVPLEVKDSATGLGDASSAGKLTVLVWPGPASSFALHEEDGEVTSLRAEGDGGATVRLSRVVRPTRLRVWVGAQVEQEQGLRVSLGEAELPRLDGPAQEGAGWWVEARTRSVWVQVPAQGAEAVVRVALLR